MFTLAQMAALRARVQLARVRAVAAQQDRERGALSIELALLVLVLIVAAGLVVAAITKLVTSKANQIGSSG
jgi:Flp pilus assembly protein TadG